MSQLEVIELFQLIDQIIGLIFYQHSKRFPQVICILNTNLQNELSICSAIMHAFFQRNWLSIQSFLIIITIISIRALLFNTNRIKSILSILDLCPKDRGNAHIRRPSYRVGILNQSTVCPKRRDYSVYPLVMLIIQPSIFESWE